METRVADEKWNRNDRCDCTHHTSIKNVLWHSQTVSDTGAHILPTTSAPLSLCRWCPICLQWCTHPNSDARIKLRFCLFEPFAHEQEQQQSLSAHVQCTVLCNFRGQGYIVSFASCKPHPMTAECQSKRAHTMQFALGWKFQYLATLEPIRVWYCNIRVDFGFYWRRFHFIYPHHSSGQ